MPLMLYHEQSQDCCSLRVIRARHSTAQVSESAVVIVLARDACNSENRGEFVLYQFRALVTKALGCMLLVALRRG